MFAKFRRQAVVMEQEKRTRLVQRRKVRVFHGRGPIYSWLRSHSAAIRKVRNSQPRLWIELVRDMVEDGVVDKKGRPPSANNVRMIWEFVARDVEAADAAKRAAAARPGGTFPSRISPNWRPTVVAPQSDSRAVALAPTRYGASPSTALSPTQPISGSQNSAVTSTPPDFPTVDPAGNPLPEGFVWYDNEAVLLRVALGVWGAIEGAKLIDLQRAGLAR